MSRKENVYNLLDELALEVYEFIRESEPTMGDRERRKDPQTKRSYYRTGV